MQSVPNRHAGFAAITLVETLLIHLKELGVIDESDRDVVYRIAIDSHLAAEEQDHDPSHISVATLLRVLHRREDGLKVVGDIETDGPKAKS